MSRIKIGFRAALKAARGSNLHKHRVGAVLMKGKSVVAAGCNSKKTHPLCITDFTQHAEFNVCSKVDYSFLNQLTIYIVRLTRTNRIGMSKPCEECEKLLIGANLNRVYYSNANGKMEILSWN